MTKAWIRKTTLIFFNQFHIKNIESSIMFAMSAQKKNLRNFSFMSFGVVRTQLYHTYCFFLNKPVNMRYLKAIAH